MAKDGTNRGGYRSNSGRKRTPIAEKLEKNNPGHRPIKVINPPEDGASEIEGVDMPKPAEFLSAKQRDGEDLIAGEIYKETWHWLHSLKIDKLVSKHLIQAFAMSCARWQQCQEALTKYGFIGKHPTSGAPIKSPYVAIQNDFFNQMQQSWDKLYQIVRDNCMVDFTATDPSDDIMEMLMRKNERNRKK